MSSAKLEDHPLLEWTRGGKLEADGVEIGDGMELLQTICERYPNRTAGSPGERGQAEFLVEVLKQSQYVPMPVVYQIIQIFAAINGFLDELPVKDVPRYLDQLESHFRANEADLAKEINEKKILDSDLKGRLQIAVEEFAKSFSA